VDADPADEGRGRDPALADVVQAPGQGGAPDQDQDPVLGQGVDPDLDRDPDGAQARVRDAG